MHYCQSSRCLLPFVTQEKHFDVDNTSTTLRNYECRISTRKSVYRVQALRLLSSQVHKPAPSQIWLPLPPYKYQKIPIDQQAYVLMVFRLARTPNYKGFHLRIDRQCKGVPISPLVTAGNRSTGNDREWQPRPSPYLVYSALQSSPLPHL